MIIHNVEQGSPEWLKVRAGVISASMFSTALKRLRNGDMSAEADNYAFRLAVERISGEPLDEGYVSWQMERGRELETVARALHSKTINKPVEQVGFITNDDGWLGASPDGLIGEDTGCEYKCPVSPEKLKGLYLYGDTTPYLDQVMGGMLLTDRKFWVLGIYCPALRPVGKELWLLKFSRDENYIAEMKEKLTDFNAKVNEYTKLLSKKDKV